MASPPGTPRLDKVDREIAAILVLAEMTREDAPSVATERVWLIVPRDGDTPEGAVRRAGGPPIGVDESTRPKWNDEYMHHLVTIDLDEVPSLRKAPTLAEARAVAVFVSDYEENEAFTPGTKQTAVVALTQADIDKGEWTGPEVEDPDSQAFFLVPVDVPVTVFEPIEESDGGFSALDADERPYKDAEKLRAALRAFVLKTAKTPGARLAALRSELVNNDHVGGRVLHWSDCDYEKDFLFQFTEDLLDVNLGDAGTMYVFADTAFWKGH